MENSDIVLLYEFNGRYLCPLEERFIYKIKEWRNSQIEVLRQYKPLTDREQKKWYQHMSNDKNQVLFSILEKGKNKAKNFIGYCGLVYIDYKNRRAELSFLVNPKRADNEKVHRTDFTAVLHMLCEYAFEELNLNKIVTETYSFRKKTIDTLEKFGFHRDGILREQNFAHGEYYDSHTHSILSSEWKGKKLLKN